MFLFSFSITVLLATAGIQHTSPEFCFFLQIDHVHSICIGYHSSSENTNYFSEGNYSSYYFGEVILLVKTVETASFS